MHSSIAVQVQSAQAASTKEKNVSWCSPGHSKNTKNENTIKASWLIICDKSRLHKRLMLHWVSLPIDIAITFEDSRSSTSPTYHDKRRKELAKDSRSYYILQLCYKRLIIRFTMIEKNSKNTNISRWKPARLICLQIYTLSRCRSLSQAHWTWQIQVNRHGDDQKAQNKKLGLYYSLCKGNQTHQWHSIHDMIISVLVGKLLFGFIVDMTFISALVKNLLYNFILGWTTIM